MPEPPRIEMLKGKLISIGYKISTARSISMLKERKAWINVKQCLQHAAADLINMHDQQKLFHGGVSMHNLCFSGSLKQAFFLDWSSSCYQNGAKTRINNLPQYYFMTKKNTDFDELLIHDLLALVLIYADIVTMINLDEHTPSSTLRLEYKGRPSA